MFRMRIVTLLTDFGLRDNYVAQMKGAILSRSPDCNIVDISHMVHRHNVAEAAFLLSSSVNYFPPKTVHLAVVDPGVGSNRLPIIAVTKSSVFVGPDNGILSLGSGE